MFTLTDYQHISPRLVSYRLDGDLDVTQVGPLLDRIATVAAAQGNANLLGEIVDIEDVEHFNEVFKLIGRSFKAASQIGKYAVVTDERWVRVGARIENAFMPVLEIRAFKLSEREEALAWLSTEAQAVKPAITELANLGEGIVGARVAGHLKTSDYAFVEQLLDQAMIGRTSVRLFIEYVEVDGMTPGALWADARLGFRYMNHIERVAIVGEQGLGGLVRFADLLTPTIDVLTFAEGEREEALAWLRE